MADIMESMGNVLQNKLLLQYMAGAGADISAGKGLGPGVNAITQQNIQAQNMMKLMKTLLNPADDSKATVDGSGINVKAGPTSSIFSNLLGGGDGGYFKADQSLIPPSSIPTPTPSQGGESSVANPFVGSQPDMNISAADLAGLTTQDISAALGLKHSQDQLKQQSYKSMVDSLTDIPYKRALTAQAEATTLENTPSMSVNVPGGGTVMLTPKDYIAYRKIHEDSQPAKVKEFAFAQSPAGGNFKGSFTQFMSAGDTVSMKDFEHAKATGYKGTSFYDYKIAMAKASAPSLGTKVEEHKAISDLKGEDYFKDPRSAKEFESEMSAFKTTELWSVKEEKDRPLAIKRKAASIIRDQINAGGGVDVADVQQNGNTFTWTIRWPSGTVQKITRKLE